MRIDGNFAWLRTWAAGALLLAACQNTATASKQASVAASLMKEVKFPEAMLINEPLPDTTDPRVSIMPLGPTVVLSPGDASIMALEVDDPDEREASATLMQFGEEPSHFRVPESQSGASDSVVLEDNFMVGGKLCEGHCNSIFTVEVHQKVELADGKISAGTSREVVVDCRKKGDPNACRVKGTDAGAGENSVQLLCGDPAKGDIALSGDPILDTHLDALRQLSKAIDASSVEVKSTLASIATSLGIDAASSAADIASALSQRISDQSEAGLMLLLDQPGCGVRLSQVSLALRVCDPDGVASLDALDCSGVCEPAMDASVCAAADQAGCRGNIDGDSCNGTCSGACEVTLTEPQACLGTCVGSCDGPCPDDGKGGCAGPCTGMCTGKCRKLSSDSCDGKCTGQCDEKQSGVPMCSAPLVAYCTAPMSGALSCAGDCFGEVSLTKGAQACRASSIAIARGFPRCEQTLVQLSFAFKMGTSNADQTAFASFVHDLSGPLEKLYDALGRIDQLTTADAALATAESGEIADELTSGLSASPKDKGLGCAEMRLTDANTWLDDEKQKLTSEKSDIMQVLMTLSPSMRSGTMTPMMMSM